MRLLLGTVSQRRLLVLPLIAIAVALALRAPGGPAAQSQAGLTVAVDADVEGNSPRVVGAVDRCISASVGDTVEVDVVLPAPGIPADRGIVGYEYEFYFDLNVVTLMSVDHNQLLDQAQGSNPLPFQNQLPNTDGQFITAVVDFGSSGIEPAGSSEIGSGVLSRMTVQVHSPGATPLGLREVDIRDDASEPLALAEPQRATLYAGSPCPAPSATATASAAPSATASATPQATAAPAPAVTQQPGAAAPEGGPASGSGSLAAQAPRTWPASAAALVIGAAGAMAGFALIRRRKR